jgi:hypothetical protein
MLLMQIFHGRFVNAGYPSDLTDAEWALVEPMIRQPSAAAAGAR